MYIKNESQVKIRYRVKGTTTVSRGIGVKDNSQSLKGKR